MNIEVTYCLEKNVMAGDKVVETISEPYQTYEEAYFAFVVGEEKFDRIVKKVSNLTNINTPKDPIIHNKSEILSKSIYDIPMSTRLRNKLIKLNLKKLKDIFECSVNFLCKKKGFGRALMRELNKIMKDHGICAVMTEKEYDDGEALIIWMSEDILVKNMLYLKEEKYVSGVPM